MNERYSQAREFIKQHITVNNDELAEEIAWKFTLGDIILSMSDQRGFTNVKPGDKIELYDNPLHNNFDLLIGDALCLLIREASKDILRSEDKSSESQPNPDPDISGPEL